MAKISLSTNGTTAAYTFTYNPSEIDIPQAADLSGIYNSVETVDGESITFQRSFDSRRGKLIWRGYPYDHTAFSAQLSSMGGYIGTDPLYVKFEEIGTAINRYTSYTPIKIISIDRKIRQGGAIIYDSVELVFEEVES